MARYLTPSKIGLLTLVSLYVEEAVPKSATVSVLSFLVSHIIPRAASHEIERSSTQLARHSYVVSIDDFQSLLIIHPSDRPGRTLWDRFLTEIWQLNSFDELYEFFERNAVAESAKIKIKPESPFGVFVRRCKLEFTKLQFHDTMALWNAFVAYREPTMALWAKRNRIATGKNFDINTAPGGMDHHFRLGEIAYRDVVDTNERGKGLFSQDDIEKLLEFQVDEMQRFGSRIPNDSKDQLRTMLHSNAAIPSLVHYVRFLEAWRTGDYHSSFDNLHRYFDYTMHNKDRTYYHYALLNLAILQADFGCYSEAIAAMQETISTARENKDMGCLNFSLSWLYHFSKAHPEEMAALGKSDMIGVERDGLAFLKGKAKEGGMWGLWSLSLISEAKLGLTTGESLPAIFENILRSSHLNLLKNVHNTAGSHIMVQSALWSRVGLTYLAGSCCNIFLDCYADQSSLEDVLKFICKKALILAQKGRFDEAMTQLEAVDSEMLKSIRLYQHWSVFSGIVKLKRELHRGNLKACQRLISQLSALSFIEPDVAIEVSFFKIDLLMRIRDYSAALDLVESLFSKQKEFHGDVLIRVRLMTLKAIIMDRCGRTERGFSVAVRAAALAWRSRLLACLWEVIGVIANIFNHLSEFQCANELLEAVMPQVMEVEDCYLSARCFSWLADSQVGLAGQQKDDAAKRKVHLTKALEFITSSFDEYSRLKDTDGQCEMMAKKATIMKHLGDNVLAEDYAAKYLELKRAVAGMSI